MSNEPKVLYDPYDDSNPFDIVGRFPADDESPSGWVLGWKSERLRNGSGTGWQGWIPLEYGDKFAGENGEGLKGYIPDPPRRMQGPDRIDNWVRRADLVLCRIPAEWFDARQQKAALESQQRVADLETPEGADILPGVKTWGKGQRKDKVPTFGTGSAADKALAAKLQHNK